MRLVARLSAFIGAVAVSLALADAPSPTQQNVPAAAAVSPAPNAAATSPAASTPATPALSSEEKRLLAMGYKPEMRNGEKVYCRTLPELGSRLGGLKECGTPADLNTRHRRDREELERAQRPLGPPSKT